ncbi:MAG: hypothetical protein M0P71_13145 [Melioribacteraceae bacterium]|jgi:hypothetical protein|nr:hypothetical protein [Melioribacteraceae bacterium]
MKTKSIGFIWAIFAIVILAIDIFTKEDLKVACWGCIIIANVYFSAAKRENKE